jgi:2-oxoglutarate ferredoxin oxidoreductase subunit delta
MNALSPPIQLDRERCKGCLLCLDVCPNDLIVTDSRPNLQGHFPVALVHADYCIQCRHCVDICPDQAFSLPRSVGLNWPGWVFHLSRSWHARKQP